MAKCWNCENELTANASSCQYCGVATTGEAIRQMATVGPGAGSTKQIVVGAQVAGRYQILRELGRGGMGIVYLAYDKTLAKEVALKVIPQELCLDPRAVADLKRETAIALGLTHEHIVRLYNLDLWEGQAFVTMEYVSGGTLAHLLAKKGRLSLSEALPILRQIAAALDYSHTVSPPVAHLDLKPLNILIGEDGRVKIGDYGLARVLRDATTRLSGKETSAGTLAYMAPEQVRGKGIGRHTDLYAFAAITYELLCGRPPFFTGDLRWQILNEEVAPIEGVIEQINLVLARALDKDGTNRPASATDFLKLLEGKETKSPVKPAIKPQRQNQAKEQTARRDQATQSGTLKLNLAVIPAFLLVILAAGAWYYWEHRTPPVAPVKGIHGSLIVNSKPDGAEVFVDGRKIGATPIKESHILHGGHQVEIKKENYKTWAKTVEVAGNANEGITVDLEKDQREVTTNTPNQSTQTPPTYQDSTTGMEFVYVPGGCFQMGDIIGDSIYTNSRPVHEVCVDDFYFGKYEVTQSEYEAITGTNPSKFTKGGRYPVGNVSWNDAQAFIKKLNIKSGKMFRLPTEAEWEYAARSGGKNEKYSGNNDPDGVAWHAENSRKATHMVGKKAANGLGLYDMSGNVWEWCNDWFGENYYTSSPRQNPLGPASGEHRVFRGGSWYLIPVSSRTDIRGNNSPDLRNFDIGFRVVLPVQDLQSQEAKTSNKSLNGDWVIVKDVTPAGVITAGEEEQWLNTRISFQKDVMQVKGRKYTDISYKETTYSEKELLDGWRIHPNDLGISGKVTAIEVSSKKAQDIIEPSVFFVKDGDVLVTYTDSGFYKMKRVKDKKK